MYSDGSNETEFDQGHEDEQASSVAIEATSEESSDESSTPHHPKKHRRVEPHTHNRVENNVGGSTSTVGPSQGGRHSSDDEENTSDDDARMDSGCCCLCEYQGNTSTNEVIRFIMEGIPHIALDSLVTQSKYMLDTLVPGNNNNTEQVRLHITEHMLHPRVKLALQLHEMTRMQKDLSKCCVVYDVESGEKNVNQQAMRVYLTLSSQISAVYKLGAAGEEKLMYNQASMDK